MRSSTVYCLVASMMAVDAFTSAPASRSQTALSAEVSRTNFFKQVAGTAASIAIMNPTLPAFADDVTTLPSGTSYVVVKTGEGPQPRVGELAGIRFKAEVKQTGNKIDDIFDTPEPYYTRVGSGGLLKVSS